MPLTQAETNGDKLSFFPESSTAGVQVVCFPSNVIYTRPPNFSALGIESDGDLTKVDTLDGHTAQTGDSFARIGVNGAGLSAIPWNASWDAEVQSEVNDALVALGLDHLVSVAASGTDITDNSIIAYIVSKSATADWDDFNNTTDSLQALRDNQGGANVTITPLSSTVSAGAVSDTDLTAYTETTPSYAFTVTDDAGDAVDLSSETLDFNVFNRRDNSILFTVSSPTITISGASSNIATVPLTEVHTAEANEGNYDFNLRGETSNLIYARGTIKIRFEADATA